METIHNERYPSHYDSWITLKNGKRVLLRPILETDGHLLLDLFNKLSLHTKHLRFFSLPPTLSENILFQLTHVNYDSTFAFVAVIEEDGKDAIIAVSRYGYNPNEHFTEVAVVVRDDWQQYGLGKSLLKNTFAVGKEHGISSFVGIINPENNVIRQLLSELGYEVKYSSRSGYLQVEIVV